MEYKKERYREHRSLQHQTTTNTKTQQLKIFYVP